MSLNAFIKHALIDILAWRTNLSDSYMHNIAEHFSDRVSSSRHALVPTYLTDEMFEAIRLEHPNLDFKTANSIYGTAIREYSRHDRIKTDPENEGSFW